MNPAIVELGPYLMLVVVGFLPNEIWRVLGLVMARGLDEDSELVIWSRAVATAILAGVIAKLILFSSGELANIPLGVRIGATACAFIAYAAMKRSVFAGVIAGEAALLLGGFLFHNRFNRQKSPPRASWRCPPARPAFPFRPPAASSAGLPCAE